MCAHSWACKASELIYFWCWNGVVFHLVKEPFWDLFKKKSDIFVKNAIEYQKNKTKQNKRPLFSDILGQSEKGKQTSFFFFFFFFFAL